MVKKLTVEINKVSGHEHEGYFLDSTSYDHVVDYDADVYDTEGNLVVVFRKGVLNETLRGLADKDPFEYFKSIAKSSVNDNRGLAAGRIDSMYTSSGRPRLTSGQYNVCFKGKRKKGGWNSFEEIEKTLKEGSDPSSYVWLARTYDELDWDAFLQSVKEATPEEWPAMFKEFFDYFIDAQKRANGCHSNVLGGFARTGRNPYCRLSSVTQLNPEAYEYFSPLYQEVSKISEKAFPEKASLVKEGLSGADPYYTLFNTMFTCITVNWNFRLASHFDGRNFEGGFATLTAFERGEYGGHYLVFPELRLAFDLRQGDTISADTSNLLHGNTEKTGDGERVSLVFFTRQDIAKLCHSRPLDECRKAFYHHAKKNKIGAKTRKGWKGGSQGMFDTPEWYEFVEEYKAENGVDFVLKERDKMNA